MPGKLPGIETVCVDFAKDVEVRDAPCFCPRRHSGDECLPEFRIHVLRRIDAKPVNAITVDPAAKNIDHPRNNFGMLGHKIVETDKVAHRRTLIAESGVAPIVIKRNVIEPCRHFDRRFVLLNERCVGISRIGQLCEVCCSLHLIAREPGIDCRTRKLATPLIRVISPRPVSTAALWALAVGNHVGRVIGNDIHINLDATRMCCIDEGFHVGISAKMWINRCKIGYPVTVIARRFTAWPTLHGLVLEDGTQPDCGHAHALNIIEPRGQAFQIAAIEKCFRRRIITRFQPVPCKATAIVRPVTIFEPVGQHEIHDFIFGQARAIIGCGRRTRQHQQCRREAHAVTVSRAAQFCATKSA